MHVASNPNLARALPLGGRSRAFRDRDGRSTLAVMAPAITRDETALARAKPKAKKATKEQPAADSDVPVATSGPSTGSAVAGDTGQSAPSDPVKKAPAKKRVPKQPTEQADPEPPAVEEPPVVVEPPPRTDPPPPPCRPTRGQPC